MANLVKFTPITDDRLNELVRSGVIFDAYFSAQVKLENIIHEIEQVGVPTTDAEFRRLKNLESQVNNITTALEKIGMRTIPKGVNAAYRNIQLQHADAIADILPEDIEFQASFSKVDQRKVAIFAESILTDLNAAAEGSAKKIKNILRRTQLLGETDVKLSQALQTEQIVGSSIREMTGVVRDIIEEEIGKNGGFVTIRGKDGIERRYQLSKYSELVVRTRTREVATAAVKQTMASAATELGVEPIVEITTHPHEPDICTEFLRRSVNNRFALVPNHPVYPYIETAGGGGPPWHPNCLHVATPFIPDDF